MSAVRLLYAYTTANIILQWIYICINYPFGFPDEDDGKRFFIASGVGGEGGAIVQFLHISYNIYGICVCVCGVQTTTGPLKNERRPKPINQTTTRVPAQTLPPPLRRVNRNRLNTIHIYTGTFIPDIVAMCVCVYK